MNGPYPEDHHSNTVEDAASYERIRAQYDSMLAAADEHTVDPADGDEDYYDDLEYEFEDYADKKEREEELEEGGDEDEDRCFCSDPCCPCEGAKYGTP